MEANGTVGMTGGWEPPRGQHCRDTDLNAILRQVRLQRQHFAGVDVGVVSFFKGLLQFLQLIAGENRPGNQLNRSLVA